MISIEKQTEICNKAIRTFGGNNQMIKACEECGELIQALSKYVLNQNSDVDNVCEEIADVEIMCQQMREIFSSMQIDDWKAKKFKKLEGVVW